MGLFSDIAGALKDPLDLFGGRAQERATDIQATLSSEGLDLQRALFNQLFEDQAPIREARDRAIGLLDNLEFSPDPSLDFRREEGLRDIRQQQAALGKLGAGERFVREQDFESRLAGEDLNQALSRILNLAGFSTQDLTQTNPVLQQNIGSQADLMNRLGFIRGNDIVGRSNIRNQAINSGFGLLGFFNPGGIFDGSR